MTTALFQNCGAQDGETTFASIVPEAAEGVDLVGNLEIQYLDFGGGTDWDNDYYWDGTAWLKDGSDDASAVVIPAGQGMWVNNMSGAPVNFRSAGEVNQKDIEYPIRSEGGTPAANSFPCAITFGDIVPIAAEGVDLVGNVEIQYLDFGGGTDWDNDYYWDGTAWLKDGSDDASETSIAIGQGFWVNNMSGAPITLRIAAPTL